MDRRQQFRDLHQTPFIMPNPWDIGSAKILAAQGFAALATSSAGHAAALGRVDGAVTRDEAIEHARQIVGATPLPVSADLENGFGHAPEQVADTIALAVGTGLAGCSIEDYGGAERGLYPKELAVERIRAAVEASRRDASPLVLTARAENHFRGNPDLADTIDRLQGYQEAGADVLYAPALMELGEIRSLVESVDRPVNVIIMPGGPSISELFEAGASRISIGNALNVAAYAALIESARELLDAGTHEFWARSFPAMRGIYGALSKE